MLGLSGTATDLSENGVASERSRAGNKTDDSGLARWYAVQTNPRQEKRLYERLRLLDLESFLPLYQAVHRWKNGCKAQLDLPLFPGYLFVRIALRECLKVLSSPGAVSLVGLGSGPWPLPDAEIANLRNTLEGGKLEPHPYLTVGQRVRIKSGPLADLTGYLVRQPEGLRVVLCVELIRQAAAVQVDVDDVEPIGPATRSLDA